MTLIQLSRQSHLLSKEAGAEKLLGLISRGRKSIQGASKVLRRADDLPSPVNLSSIRTARKPQALPRALSSSEAVLKNTPKSPLVAPPIPESALGEADRLAAFGGRGKVFGDPSRAELFSKAEAQIAQRGWAPKGTVTNRPPRGLPGESVMTTKPSVVKVPKSKKVVKAPKREKEPAFTPRKKQLLAGTVLVGGTGLGVSQSGGDSVRVAGLMSGLVRGGLFAGKKLGRLALGGKVRRGVTAMGVGAAIAAPAGAKAQWGVPLKAVQQYRGAL